MARIGSTKRIAPGHLGHQSSGHKVRDTKARDTKARDTKAQDTTPKKDNIHSVREQRVWCSAQLSRHSAGRRRRSEPDSSLAGWSINRVANWGHRFR